MGPDVTDILDSLLKERRWHLIHNDNGEWISDRNAVILTPILKKLYECRAKDTGLPLDIQHGPDGTLWCYLLQVRTFSPKRTKEEWERCLKNVKPKSSSTE